MLYGLGILLFTSRTLGTPSIAKQTFPVESVDVSRRINTSGLLVQPSVATRRHIVIPPPNTARDLHGAFAFSLYYSHIVIGDECKIDGATLEANTSTDANGKQLTR